MKRKIRMTIPLYFRVFWQLNNNNKLRAINFKSRLRLYNGGMPDIKRLPFSNRFKAIYLISANHNFKDISKSSFYLVCYFPTVASIG